MLCEHRRRDSTRTVPRILAQGNGMRRVDDGLVQRFQLLVWPDTSERWVNLDCWPDAAAKQLVFEVFQRLDTLDGAECDDDGALSYDSPTTHKVESMHGGLILNAACDPAQHWEGTARCVLPERSERRRRSLRNRAA